MTSRIFQTIGAVFLGCSLIFTHNGFSQETKVRRAVIGYPSLAVDYLPLFVSRDRGFFREEGLREELVQIRGDALMKGLLAGDVDYSGAFGSVIRAAVSGAPTKVIFSLLAKPVLNIISKPTITSVKELKGKRVAISSFGTNSEYTVRLIAAHYGLDPERDVVMLALGENGNRLAALTSDGVDAAVLSTPFDIRAQDAGYRLLSRSADLIDLSQSGLGTTAQKIRDNPDEVDRVTRATLKGLEFVKRNRDETIAAIVRIFKLDRSLAGRVYDSVRDVWDDDGIASDGAVMRDINLARERLKITKEIKISDVADWSFVHRARAGK